jgi:hypothetical protein
MEAVPAEVTNWGMNNEAAMDTPGPARSQLAGQHCFYAKRWETAGPRTPRARLNEYA